MRKERERQQKEEREKRREEKEREGRKEGRKEGEEQRPSFSINTAKVFREKIFLSSLLSLSHSRLFILILLQ